MLSNLKQTLADSQAHYQKHTDIHWATPSKIEVGDLVFVLAKFIKTTRPSKKLSECYLGPFEVMDKPSAHSYKIKFPHHLCVIHPVFHISQLEPANPSLIPNHVNLPPLSIAIEGELEYKISQILNLKLDHRRKPPPPLLRLLGRVWRNWWRIFMVKRPRTGPRKWTGTRFS